MLSESRKRKYSITPTATSTRSLCSNLTPIDYLSLNDGLEENTPKSPKCRKRPTHRPGSAPSVSRLATQKQLSSPWAKETDGTVSDKVPETLTGIPKPPSSTAALSAVSLPSSLAVLHSELNIEILPDLVSNHANLDSTVTTEEDLATADTLLSLIEPRDDTQNEGEDDNSQLMPIGGTSNVVNTVPVPLKLDQVNVDSAIANIVEADDVQKIADSTNVVEDVTVNEDKNNNSDDTVLCNDEDYTVDIEKDKSPSASKAGGAEPLTGSPNKHMLEIKSHVLKKKSDNHRTYKCMVCGAEKSSIQKVNEHHRCHHKLQICTVCGHSFLLASSLTRHMCNMVTLKPSPMKKSKSNILKDK